MKCPDCNGETAIRDSRRLPDGAVQWRRRHCLSCPKRVTTYEMVDNELPSKRKRRAAQELVDIYSELCGEDSQTLMHIARILRERSNAK